VSTFDPSLPFREHYDVLYLTSDLLLDTQIMSGAGGLGVVAGSIASELEHNHARHRTTALFVGTYCSHGYQTQRIQNDVMIPEYELDHLVSPNPFTPGGYKGSGETGTVSVPPCLTNAVESALRPLGLDVYQLIPLMPSNVWSEIQRAKASAS
jgi:hypothetical protein